MPTGPNSTYVDDIAPGGVIGRLTLIERVMLPGPRTRYSAWRCQCECGATPVVREVCFRRPNQTRSCGCLHRDGLKAKNLARRSRTPSYSAAHLRVNRDRGSASDQACVDCGDQAKDWSYRAGSDPEEIQVPSRGGRPAFVSPNPGAYEPRCRSCHSRLDRNRGK